MERVREETLAYSAPTFLNLEEISHRAARNVFDGFKQSLLLWAAFAAIGLALVTALVPLGASYVDRYLAGRDQREAAALRSLEQKLEEQYGARIKALSADVEELRRSVATRTAKGQTATGKR